MQTLINLILLFLIISVFGAILYVLFKLADKFFTSLGKNSTESSVEQKQEESSWSLKVVKKEYYPYSAKWNFMTHSELKFFKMLEQVVENKYYIVPQVNLSNLLYLPKWEKYYKAYRSKIDKKSVDFVLFTKDEYKFHLAIELDDPTHEREDRIQRDEFVNEAMRNASLRLIRCKLLPGYDREYVESLGVLVN